jgi:hypothetical protein
MSKRKPGTFDKAIMALSYFDEDPEIKAAIRVLGACGEAAISGDDINHSYILLGEPNLCRAILAARKVKEGNPK